MPIYDLGDFPLIGGCTLPKARLSYDTHGRLNSQKNNAILFPNFLGGTPQALEAWIGPGRPLDPEKYFIILPGQFGNGISTSPGNTDPPFEKGAFPAVLVVDDVVAQHQLLKSMGIEELFLVLGWSVSALQTYEWAVRFPSFVKRAASIAGAPQPSPWTRYWLRTVIEEPLTSDANYNNGFYASPQAMQSGLRRMAHSMALTLPPIGFYREGHEVWRQIGFNSFEDFVSRFWESFVLPQDPNNLICQARKARAANPAVGTDIATALGRIKANMFVMAFNGDPMFPVDECRLDAERIPNARFREIRSTCGHLATFALTSEDKKSIDKALWEVLQV